MDIDSSGMFYCRTGCLRAASRVGDAVGLEGSSPVALAPDDCVRVGVE
jgi:hypothetical protein